jgi:outer membrane protein
MRLVLIAGLLWQQLAPGQVVPGQPAPSTAATQATPPMRGQTAPPPVTPGQPAGEQTTPAAPLAHIESDLLEPKHERATISGRSSILDFAAPYRRPSAENLFLGPADRARSLVRDGVIYLSLYDALALAIENNLNVEVARYSLSIAGTEVLRASGGGNLRGVDFTIAESPTGVGGPGSPLLNSAATSVTPSTPTVNDLTSLNILTETQTNLSVQGASGFAAGPTIPTLQPTFVGQNTWFERSNTANVTSGSLGTGAIPATPTGTLNFVTANYSLVQGFSYGTQVEVDLNNAARALYGDQPQYNPFATPNTSVTLTQPLMRGRSRDVNLRYIRIASIDQKVSRLLFYQQLISTVYGVARLYYDLVSLNENAQVKRETLAAARKLYEDNASQVEQGTLAPLELTRARSLVTSSELDLIQSEGLVHQEEVILKSQLARRGTADPILGDLPIRPTDPISIPLSDDFGSTDQLVREALATRPDLLQATLQVQSGEVALKASQGAVLPEIDLIANFQTRGSGEVPFTVLGTTGTGIVNAPSDLAVAGLRTSRIYQAGIQVNLPLKNHVAQADAARDLLQVRQAQARTQLLANQVREEVQNSVIALTTARSALNAAIQSRQYQEQLLDAERDKLSVGASTNFLVIQQQSYLAQARSTEVAARSVWIKARVALDRSIGNLLEKNGIAYDDSLTGGLPPRPSGH